MKTHRSLWSCHDKYGSQRPKIGSNWPLTSLTCTSVSNTLMLTDRCIWKFLQQVYQNTKSRSCPVFLSTRMIMTSLLEEDSQVKWEFLTDIVMLSMVKKASWLKYIMQFISWGKQIISLWKMQTKNYNTSCIGMWTISMFRQCRKSCLWLVLNGRKTSLGMKIL